MLEHYLPTIVSVRMTSRVDKVLECVFRPLLWGKDL